MKKKQNNCDLCRMNEKLDYIYELLNTIKESINAQNTVNNSVHNRLSKLENKD